MDRDPCRDLQMMAAPNALCRGEPECWTTACEHAAVSRQVLVTFLRRQYRCVDQPRRSARVAHRRACVKAERPCFGSGNVGTCRDPQMMAAPNAQSMGELERRCRGRKQCEGCMPLLPGPVSGRVFLKYG